MKSKWFKAKYFDIDSGDHYWISGPRKNLDDRHYGGNRDVEVDEDIADEYYAYLDSKREPTTNTQGWWLVVCNLH